MTSAEVRDDWVPKQDYISETFAELEGKRLWPRVWQMACREEEIPSVGDFVVYEIVEDSIVIVRSSGREIRAFFNVCQHRGRQLVEGCGHIAQFVCRYHGWKYTLDGRCSFIADADDWGGQLSCNDMGLKPVRVSTWGGFVFINMDENAEPLENFLSPVIKRCEKFEFEKMRFFWYRTFRYPCNWKVAIEGFDESYHVQQSHPQLLEHIKDNTQSRTFGLHGNQYWNFPAISRFGPADRLNKAADPDHRTHALAYHKEIHDQLGAMTTPRTYRAIQRIVDEVPANASPAEVVGKMREYQREAAEADGAGFPDITPEYMAASGFNWHVFPNLVFQHLAIDGLLFYRTRPDGKNVDSCLFDVWSLVRYAPGKEPPLKREFYEDWHECAEMGRILTQDFVNLDAVQRGMKSRGFHGARTNPVQERSVSNLHRSLRVFLDDA